MKKLLPLLPLLLTMLHGPALAEEREWLPYKTLLEVSRVDKFHALPAAERDKLDMYIHLQPSMADVSTRDRALTVVHTGGRSPLPIDAAGNLRVTPNPEWLAEDAKIMTNQPKKWVSAQA